MSAAKLLSSFAERKGTIGPLSRGGGDAKVGEADVAKWSIANRYDDVRGDFCITIFFRHTLAFGGFRMNQSSLQIKRHSLSTPVLIGACCEIQSVMEEMWLFFPRAMLLRRGIFATKSRK